MKKVIALVLTAVMCLALCACGVDEKYTALLEHLDAGNFEGIKTELTALSPDFQAEQDQMTANAALLEKYGDLLAALEAEDYEAALEDILGRMPVPEEPVYAEVVITMDNWTTYFELRPYEECTYNDFGELTFMRSGYALYLKEEYLPLLKEGGADVSFRVGATAEYWEADFETCARIEGGSMGQVEEEEITPKVIDCRMTADSKNYVCTANGQVAAVMVCNTGYSDMYRNWWGYYTDSFDIREVIGTLMLAQ